eukprot:scaffold141445_cov46-Prasinocladus_malaysianus.AAC.1
MKCNEMKRNGMKRVSRVCLSKSNLHLRKGGRISGAAPVAEEPAVYGLVDGQRGEPGLQGMGPRVQQ